MPRPNTTSAIIRPDLGVVAYEYLMDAPNRGFIGTQILPIFETALQTSQYPIIPLEAVLKTQDVTRAPRGNYARDDYEFEMGNYACKDRGYEEPLDEIERKLYANLFDAEEVATQRAIDKVLRAQEVRIAAKVFSTSNITGTSDISTEWSTAATATPQADVVAAKKLFRAASGLLPDSIAMSWTVFMNLLQTKEIKDVFRYTNPIEIGGFEAQKSIVAQYFGVRQILVGGAVKDSTGKGKSTVIADVWDDEYILLFRAAVNARDLREPCLGRTFLWIEDSPQELVVENYREEQIRSDVYRVRHNVDEAFVFTAAGYLLGNITA